MARLPVPGSDHGSWGQILNDFLLVAHNPDGTSKLAEIVADKYMKPPGGIPETDLSGTLQSKINNKADTGDLAAVAFSGDYDDLTNKPAGGGGIAASGNVLTYNDPTNEHFLRINIPNDGSPTGDWPDRLVFYHNTDGTYRRTGGFNEFGEIRSDASRWNRVAMRAHGFGTAGTQAVNPQSADIFQVSLYRGGPVLFGVGRLAITASIPIEAPNIGVPIKAVLDFGEQPDDPQPGDIYLIRPE